jgi:hypothetical protein
MLFIEKQLGINLDVQTALCGENIYVPWPIAEGRKKDCELRKLGRTEKEPVESSSPLGWPLGTGQLGLTSLPSS